MTIPGPEVAVRLLAALMMAVAFAAAVPAALDAFQAGAPLADARTVLQALARAQTEYRASHGRYTASLRALGLRRPPDVDVRITAEGPGGYAAVALAEAEECAVFYGTALPPRSYARTAGRVACRAR
jgi:type II secretory pathway pseudopilin PulG